MRFLADESCDFAVVRALRDAGFNVVAVGDVAPGAEDRTVADLAVREDRMLVTEDKDFGQFVFAEGTATGGVLLLRFPAAARTAMAPRIPGLECPIEVIEKYDKIEADAGVAQR